MDLEERVDLITGEIGQMKEDFRRTQADLRDLLKRLGGPLPSGPRRSPEREQTNDGIVRSAGTARPAGGGLRLMLL